GVCIHHDAGALGAAVPKEVWRNRLATLKELGSNAIRMSHYPHQDYIYELCDEMGFLVQDEAFDEWEIPKNKWIEGWNAGTPGNDANHDAFNEWAERDVMDMVRRNRNRPSIIMWSIGNEIDYPNDPYSHPVLDEGRNPQIYGKGYIKDNPPASELGDISRMLVAAVKKIDTTRPVTAALAGVAMSNHTDYPDNLDIVGYNYQEYRYPEDHEKYPDRVIYGSENGDALEAWLAVSENQYISSQFLWTAFDFIGEARPWPSRSSGAGIIDLAGNPKPDFYFRQSLWSDDPMVYLGVAENEKQVIRRNNITDSWTGKTGETKWVTCYSNADEVELFLNGQSLGKKEVEYKLEEMVAWEVDFQPGELKAVAFSNGGEVATYILNTPGEVEKISGELSKSQFNKSHEVIELNIRLTDEQGNLVETSDLDLALSIDGPADIIGLESGDLSSHENYQAKNRKTYKGKLKAYIKTTGNTAPVTIKVTNPALQAAEFKIDMK
ncbi:MAG TPA: glycoside hydrolase family 2 TIM barrel-domain containing protein, partial [Anditalea sp.]|nr:glycoside hydrolase family 2 TIM barrel-domain containing protein [Anditalea sp.]